MQIPVYLIDGKIRTIREFEIPDFINNGNEGFLNGFSYEKISKRLEELNIEIPFNNNLNSLWEFKENINTYNQNDSITNDGFKFTSNFEGKSNIILKVDSKVWVLLVY